VSTPIIGSSDIAEAVWDVGDGRRFHGSTVRIPFERPGTYVLSVRVVNRFDMYGTARAIVRIGPGALPERK
jgi:PKD domain